MMPPTDPPVPPSDHIGLGDETSITSLDVQGVLPARLAGRLLAIGPCDDHPMSGASEGVVHAVHLHAGGAVSYRSRSVISDALAERLGVSPTPRPRSNAPELIANGIIAFRGSILALGESSFAYELSPDLTSLRRVELAGQSRRLAASPRPDPVTGDLHLVTVASSGSQAHVIVAANALTRTSHTIAGATAPIKDPAISHNHVLFLADGCVAVTRRNHRAQVKWIPTDLDTPDPVHAHETGDDLVVYTLTPSLERWTLNTASATIDRQVLDPTPQRSARTSDHDNPVDTTPRFLWTTTDGATGKHDLLTGCHIRHSFRPGQLSEFVVVADTTEPGRADAGWLVGFVHHPASAQTDLVVLDASDIAQPSVATVRLPRPLPQCLHTIWLPATQDTP